MRIMMRHHEPEWLAIKIEYLDRVFDFDFSEGEIDIYDYFLNFASAFPAFMREAYEAGKRGEPFELDQVDESAKESSC